jgi:hypothetical protein
MEAGLTFRQLFCRAVDCGVMFFICRSCYRGQAYCNAIGRKRTRREQLRQANRRYQQTTEARLDHRDRQRDYRQRRFGRVTDQSSKDGCSWGRISEPLVTELKSPVEEMPDDLSKQERFRRIFCIICGRWGRFIDFFRRE